MNNPTNPTTKSETLSLLAVLIVATLASTVMAEVSPLDFILEPIARLDIAGTYLRQHLAIDAILFFAFFLALSQITLRGQFPGRAGSVLVFTIAAALTISLILAENAVGFSLQDFGPVAAAIFVATFAVVLYRFVSHLGLGMVGSGALSVAVAYLGARAAAPALFAYAFPAPLLAWLNLGAVIALAVFIGRTFMTLFHGRDILLAQVAKSVERPVRALREEALSADETRRMDRERDTVGAYLSRIVDRPWKDSAEILFDLGAIRKAIERYGSSPQGRTLIAEKIRTIAVREHVVVERLKAMHALNERLKSFDLRLLTRLQSAYDRLSEEERTEVREAFQREVQKVALEKEYPNLESAYFGYDHSFRDALEHAVANLRLGRLPETRQWIDRAIGAEGEAADILEKIEQLEGRLKALTQVPIGQLRQRGPAQQTLFD